ncbi:DUF3649 domain-containing protein [Flintibacter sp.]
MTGNFSCRSPWHACWGR